MRYTEPGYSRNDFGVVGRYQCSVKDNIPNQKTLVAMAIVRGVQVPVGRAPLPQVHPPQAHVHYPNTLVPLLRRVENIEETEDVDWARLAAEEAATARVVKPCPWCGKATYLIDGCNYMNCSQSDPVSTCPAEWCFQCGKEKFKPIPGREYLGCCNDQTHNSH